MVKERNGNKYFKQNYVHDDIVSSLSYKINQGRSYFQSLNLLIVHIDITNSHTFITNATDF